MGRRCILPPAPPGMDQRRSPCAQGLHLLTAQELDAHPWASSGHAACAALLGVPLGGVRKAFPDQRDSRVHPIEMRQALVRLGLAWRMTAPLPPVDELPLRAWPVRGLLLIQFRGPWERPGVHIGASFQRATWIATAPLSASPMGTCALVDTDDPWVFDVDTLGPFSVAGWSRRAAWEAQTAPEHARRYPRASGAWWVRCGIEVGP